MYGKIRQRGIKALRHKIYGKMGTIGNVADYRGCMNKTTTNFKPQTNC